MKKKNYVVNFILIISLTLIALWFVLHKNFNEVIDVLKTMTPFTFILILLYGLFYNAIIGCVYTVLGRNNKKDYKFIEGLQVSFVGSFFSGITPSATGGQFGQIYVYKHQGIKYSQGASILWIDFIIYQSVMVIYCGILLIFRFSYYYHEFSNLFIFVLFGYFINSMVIVFLYTMARFPKAYEKISAIILKILGKLKFIKNPENTIIHWNQQLRSFTKEIKNIKKEKVVVCKCIILNIIRLTLYYAFPFFIGYLLHLNIKISLLLDIIAMSAFVSTMNAFFPVPGSSGGTEATFVLMFSRLFDKVTTNSIMILWRFVSYHCIILLGGLTFICLTNKYDKQKTKIEEV